MTEQTTEAPPRIVADFPGSRGADQRSADGAGSRIVALMRRYPWWFTAAALIVVAVIVVRGFNTRPGFDPFGWLTWGQDTLNGTLDTNGAPSWKPMPYLFTVPYALFGHWQLWLWMTTAVAVSLSALVFAWRIAYRLTLTSPDRRVAAHIAGLVAALTLLGIANYSHFILSDQSDTMIVATCLGAIDCQLSGRYRWAFVLWWLGSLGRPEVWPFLGLYTVWAWRTHPQLRKMIVGGLILIPLLWFGIPALTAKSFFIAGDNALNSPREIHGNKITGTLDRFFALYPASVWIGAAFAVVLAAINRRRSIVLIGAGAALWVIVECAFAVHGWPAVPRYLFEAAAACAVLVGIAVGLVLTEGPRLLRRLAPHLSPQLATGLGAIVAVAFLATLVPAAHSQWKTEVHDLKHEHARTAQINRLNSVVNLVGAKRLLACGQPAMTQGWQSILAWQMKKPVGTMWFSPSTQRRRHFTYIQFLQLGGGGWRLIPRAVKPSNHAACHTAHIVLRP